MSITSEILRIQKNIADTYAAVADMGGNVPLSPTSANLEEAVRSIPAEEGAGSLGGNPIGTVISFMGKTAPDGYLACEGGVFNISSYPALADFFRTQFGSVKYFGGNGTTTFAVPNMSGRFALNANASHAVGQTGGSETVTLSVAQIPEHDHDLICTTSSGNSNLRISGGSSTSSTQYINNDSMKSAGSSQPHDNMPPYMAVLYCIKAVEEKPTASTGDGMPSGSIIIWSGEADAVPTGWALCNGENGTPDLRDKFILGAGETHEVGETGGEEEHTLTVEELAEHSHAGKFYSTLANIAPYNGNLNIVLGNTWKNSTDTTGGSKPHNNMPPYYSLCYIMKL